VLADRRPTVADEGRAPTPAEAGERHPALEGVRVKLVIVAIVGLVAFRYVVGPLARWLLDRIALPR